MCLSFKIQIDYGFVLGIGACYESCAYFSYALTCFIQHPKRARVRSTVLKGVSEVCVVRISGGECDEVRHVGSRTGDV